MTCDLVALCIDANDPRRVAEFWAGVLGWEVDGSGDVIGLLPPDDTGFRLRFPRTLEPKVGPNQFHFDLRSVSPEQQQETVARALSLGGRHHDVGQLPEEEHVVLADPRATSSASSRPGTTSWPTAGSSERCRATAHRPPATSGARRSAGRWSGTRTRRPPSARPTAARRSPGVARRCTRRSARSGCTSTWRRRPMVTSRSRSSGCSPSGRPGWTSGRVRSAGWCWPTPTATSSACFPLATLGEPSVARRVRPARHPGAVDGGVVAFAFVVT